MSILGKKVLVTGGGTGIGRAAAAAFAAAGCRVAIAGRREHMLQQAASSISAEVPVVCRPVDVADRDSVRRLAEWLEQQWNELHIVVHAAGVNIKNRAMGVMRPEQWDHVLAVNATGVYNCLWALLPIMRRQRDGLVINVSSISGKRASDLGGIAYCASKFAATGLGTAVGLEEASHGIRITNVYPGEVETPILDQRPEPVSAERRSRMLQPEDVAAILVAIASLPPRAHVPEIVIKPVTQTYS